MPFSQLPQHIAERLALGGAGALGAAIALTFMPQASILHRAASILAGFACAMWFTGPVVDLLTADAEVAHGLAFVIGILGMHLVEAVVKVGRVVANRAPRVAEKAIDKALGEDNEPPAPKP